MTTIRGFLIAALLLTISGCAGTSPSASKAIDTGLRGTATAGPVCPVERTPPDPACAPRPVGAVLIVRDAVGSEVGRTTTDADGTFDIALGAGDYSLEPQPVEGLLGTAPSQQVTVVASIATTVEVLYDTGIRGPAPAS